MKKMDALKRPLKIPPAFGSYAEKKQVFQLYERMLQELLIARPDDPLQYLFDYLSREKENVPKVIVYGPPASGRYTISKLVARKLDVVQVRLSRVLVDDQSPAGEKARGLQQDGKEIPDSLWVEMVHSRLQRDDCVKKGWVLEGYPITRQQALMLQSKGLTAKHFVHLEAPDAVLVERYAGKRIDTLTGDVYHLVFSPPSSEEIASRLVQEPGDPQANMKHRLTSYHEHSHALLSCFGNISKKFNADQPIDDLFSQVYGFLCTQHRSAAPHTPRVVLLGPTACGKSLQAAQIAMKYCLVNVDCRELIKQTMFSDSKLGEQMKLFYNKKMLIPDDMVIQVLTKRLEQLDCATRGWVLHGFPLTRDQAELLTERGHHPNRVIVLDVPEDAVMERLTYRRVDPVTGERYHLMFKPPPTQVIKDRLQMHPRDTEEQVQTRTSLYSAYVEDLLEYYPRCQHVNGDQDPLTVFECIESILVQPLPTPP